MFNAMELVFFLINNITEGIIIFDEELEVIYANHNAEKYLGVPNHQIMGKHCKNLLGGIFCSGNGIVQKAIETKAVVKQSLTFKNEKYQLKAFSFKGIENKPAHKILLINPAICAKSTEHEEEAPPEKETIKINKEEIIAKQCSEEIIEDIEDLADAKNIPVSAEIDPFVDKLYIDKHQMEYAIINLLSKAINFSDMGTITIQFSETETGNANLVIISNNEEKLKDQHLKELRSSFIKGTDKSKNIVEAHGGKLWINTDHGFSINFTIPKLL